MLTQAELKSYLNYNPDTGVFTWLPHPKMGKRCCVGKQAGSLDKLGYVRIKLRERKYFAHRLAWLYVHGEWPALEIDHINRTPGDNRIKNLRLATRIENQRNSKFAGTSGYVGIYYIGWRAEARINGKRTAIGHYKTKEEAVQAQKDFIQVHGHLGSAEAAHKGSSSCTKKAGN